MHEPTMFCPGPFETLVLLVVRAAHTAADIYRSHILISYVRVHICKQTIYGAFLGAFRKGNIIHDDDYIEISPLE